MIAVVADRATGDRILTIIESDQLLCETLRERWHSNDNRGGDRLRQITLMFAYGQLTRRA